MSPAPPDLKEKKRAMEENDAKRPENAPGQEDRDPEPLTDEEFEASQKKDKRILGFLSVIWDVISAFFE